MGSVLEEKDAIRETLALYCHYGDGLEYEKWLALFTDDAVLEVVEGLVKRGKDELREFVGGRIPRDGKSRLKHCVMNEVIEVRGDEAHALSYLLEIRREDNGELRNRVAGRYEDTLVKQAGKWRFKYRRVHLDLRSV